MAVLAVDPAGAKGLWLRGPTSAVRNRVTAALPTSRRIHPGIDDTSLFGGVDLAATLARGQLVRSRGLLAEAAPAILTMAERCPPGLFPPGLFPPGQTARLSRWLEETGPCLIALDARILVCGQIAARNLSLEGITGADAAATDLDSALAQMERLVTMEFHSQYGVARRFSSGFASG